MGYRYALRALCAAKPRRSAVLASHEWSCCELALSFVRARLVSVSTYRDLKGNDVTQAFVDSVLMPRHPVTMTKQSRVMEFSTSELRWRSTSITPDLSHRGQ